MAIRFRGAFLGSVEADTPEEAVEKAWRDPEVLRRALPCGRHG